LMMLAVHIQDDSRPNLSQLQSHVKRLDPAGLNQKKIQSGLGTMPLDAMDEEIIRIQLMRHRQVINARHRLNYLSSVCRLSTDWISSDSR